MLNEWELESIPHGYVRYKKYFLCAWEQIIRVSCINFLRQLQRRNKDHIQPTILVFFHAYHFERKNVSILKIEQHYPVIHRMYLRIICNNPLRNISSM